MTPSPKKQATVKAAPKADATARKTALTYADVVAAALQLPGVEESRSYNTPSLKVKGKLMSRLRSEAEGGLALRCDFMQREMLLQADPQAFFLTDHYRDYPMILIHLEHLRRDALTDLLERAWRMVAPTKLMREFDAGVGATTETKRPPRH